MISPEEEKFYQQWEKERIQPHYKRRPFLRGLSGVKFRSACIDYF
jgi:hypothetical protein